MMSTVNSESYTQLLERQHELQHTVAELKTRLAYSKRELQNTTETLRKWRHRIYPVLTLPDEITSLIFVHCVYEDALIPLGPYDVRMKLLRVCRAWRWIAISTPDLWTGLHLKFNRGPFPYDFFETDRFEGFLDDWVARLAALPLTLNLHGGRCLSARAEAWIPLILDKFSSNLHTLAIFVPISGYPECPPTFPLLRKIALSVPDLAFEYGQLKENPLHLQVEVFTASKLEAAECINVLNMSPALVEFTARNVPDRVLSGIPTVSHDHLKSLSLVRSDVLLSKLGEFPALETLDNILTDQAKNLEVSKFISSSGCSASASLVRLSCPAVHPKTFVETDALRTLKLYSTTEGYMHKFAILLNRKYNPLFLPQLEVLEIEDSQPVVNIVLSEALTSRSTVSSEQGAKLSCFRQLWRNVVAEGLKVDFEGSTGLILGELAKNGMIIDIRPGNLVRT
ncbi:hypothetical protein R3P38DRAFT_2853359 [Favolaschia claudopus]|uniref:F-box domain-containing protein n=1 Tax=Favolaschia claudopus TaxID=2862362 RepID=A0AAW0DMX4_9AGAR